MVPASAAQRTSPNPDRGVDLGSLLGNDYERKKKKLLQELQLDYKHYTAQKKDQKTSEPGPQPQGLSLPIEEKISVQQKLREERNREYNLFLQEQAQIKRFKRATPPVTSKVQALDAMHVTSLAAPLPIINNNTNTRPPPRERPASRRDAATLTETVDNGKSTWARGQGGRRPRRWQPQRTREPSSPEGEPITDSEDELELRHRRRRDRHTPEPEYKQERRTNRANRAPQGIKKMEAFGVHEQNNNEYVWKSDLQVPNSTRTAARPTHAASKDKAEFATGLMIGAAEEQTASQTRKEQYKEELLEQIAEQQRNKIREKQLELRVAATGATDPEKQPDRIKQFGEVNRQHDSWRQDVPHKPTIDLRLAGNDTNPRPREDKTERKGPKPKSHVDHSTAPEPGTRAAQGVPILDYFNEAYHRDFSSILGEMANPRVADVPPPGPTTVTNSYKTPYDSAYYHYGTRNPLDLKNDIHGGGQQSENLHSPPQKPPAFRPEASDQHQSVEEPSRERALSYQEALRQQIKEREERKKREKEEQERYDAKLKAEMMAYQPWGRSGAGAPIKDQKGNLVNDLNQMHRTNIESYRNPVSRSSKETESYLLKNGGEDINLLPGVSSLPTPSQLNEKDRYKEELRQQIEAKKQKQIEEAEQMRIADEKDEKRLQDERARILLEFEEDQRRNRVKYNLKNQERIHEPTTKHQETKKIEEEKIETKVPELTYEVQQQREPSPPIPTLRKKQTNPVASRPSSTRTHNLKNQDRIHEPTTQRQEEKGIEEEEIETKVSESFMFKKEKKEQLTYELQQQREPSPPIPTLRKKQTNPVTSRSSPTRTRERSVSPPHSQPVPAVIHQLHDSHYEVIRGLSALRRGLQNEQRRLQAQLCLTDREESHHTHPRRPRGRYRWDAFESTHRQAVQPSDTTDADTAAHEEVQQRIPRIMKREEGQSFTKVYNGDEGRVHQQRRRRPSAERQERTNPQRHAYDDVTVDQRDSNIQPDAQSLQSVIGLNLDRSEEPRGDELDVLSLRSALERCVSLETVATDAWLRPGTSDTVKRSGCRERPNSGMAAPSRLTHHVS